MLAITIPLAILALIVYTYWIWNKCSLAFPFTIIFLIEIAWGTLSIIWIDSGVYITEQFRYSYTTRAAIRYILLMIPFAIVFPGTLEYKIRCKEYRIIRLETPGVSLDKIVWRICEASVIYIFIDLLLSGTPLLSSMINKIEYYSRFSKLPLAGMLHNLIMPFAMLMCGIRFTAFPNKSKKKYEAFIVAATIMLIQILMDNKFYGLYDYAIWFAIPVIGNYIKSKIKKNRVTKIPFKYIIIALIIIGVLLGICYSQYARRYTDPIAAILNRIFSLQSHTFWGIDCIVQEGKLKFDFDLILKEIVAGLSGVSSTNADYGIGRIMYLVTKSTFASDLLSTGVRFSGSFLTVSLSYAGYICTFLYSFVVGYLAASVSALFYTYLNDKDTAILFLGFVLYRRIYEYFRVGSLSIILSWKILILFFVIFGLSKFTFGKRIHI